MLVYKSCVKTTSNRAWYMYKQDVGTALQLQYSKDIKVYNKYTSRN